MRNAARILILGLAAAALAACQQKQPAANQDISVESNLAHGQLPPNAEIETLPPDESSATSTDELNAGDDNPDVNNLDNSD
jgi:hypothetical protein